MFADKLLSQTDGGMAPNMVKWMNQEMHTVNCWEDDN